MDCAAAWRQPCVLQALAMMVVVTHAIGRLPNFKLHASGPLGSQCLAHGVTRYQEAGALVRRLALGEFEERRELTQLLCAERVSRVDKHAFLFELAREHRRQDIELVLAYHTIGGDARASRIGRSSDWALRNTGG